MNKLFSQIATALSDIPLLKHLSRGQWISLSCYVLAGAALGVGTAMADPHHTMIMLVLGGATGALSGFTGHVSGLLSPVPNPILTSDEQREAIKAAAVVKQSEAQGREQMEKASAMSCKPTPEEAKAAAEFAKELRK